MAKSVLELAVGTGQWDAGLKKAKSALDNFVQANGGLQIALDKDTDKIQEFVKMMGQMDSTAKTAKGQMNDYKSTIEQLTMQYNRMTEAQKKTIGQDYLNTIDQLKQKYQAAKNEIKTMGDSLNNTGGILGQLKEKFTINIDAVKLFNMGLTASKAVLDVAKDAFFNNEQNLDEWGRTVESVESVYKGFLNSLNTGDISGFLSNIQTITQAARDAYDALDELATFTAFNKANVAGARADLTGAIADYREGKGSKEGVSEASDKLIKELEQKQKLQKEAYQKVIAKVAAERGVKESDLMKVMTGNYGTFKELKDLQYTGRNTRLVATGGTFTSGPTYRTITEAVPANEREKLAQAIKHLNDTEIDNFQSLAEAAKMTEVEINNQRKMVARVLNGKQGGSGGEGGRSGGGGTTEPTYAADSIAAQQALVQQLTKQWNEAGEGVREVYLRSLIDAEAKLKNMKNDQALLKEQMQGRLLGGNVQTSGIGGSLVQLPTVGEGLSTDTMNYIKSLQQGGKDVTNAWKTAASSINQVGSAMRGLNNPAIDIMLAVGQAIATIGLAYAESLSQTAEKKNIWAFIAAASAATISLASTIASFHSATGYAQGGKIEGNSYSGDNIAGLVDGSQLVGLNAGEIVLNQAQQSNVASGLRGGAMSGMRLQTKVKGTELLIWVDNALAQSGRGELVTWGT